MTEIEWFHENITFIDILCYLYCCSQYVRKFGKVSSGHRTGKGQFSFQSQRRAMPKNVQTTVQFNMLAR